VKHCPIRHGFRIRKYSNWVIWKFLEVDIVNIHLIIILEKVCESIELDDLSLIHIFVLEILHDLELVHCIVNYLASFKNCFLNAGFLHTLILGVDYSII
jgi:hypothetical protein